jgi:hypothetical protein
MRHRVGSTDPATAAYEAASTNRGRALKTTAWVALLTGARLGSYAEKRPD